LKLLDDTEPSLVIPISDSTLGAGLESMKRMTRAALYAGVSSERQKQEQTGRGAQAAELLPPVTRSSRNTLMTDTAGRKWIGRHWSSCARN
jgi:hypothetical protein